MNAGRSARRYARLVLRGWVAHCKHLSSSGFFVLISTVEPVVYATLAQYLLRAGGRPDALVYAAVGAHSTRGCWPRRSR